MSKLEGYTEIHVKVGSFILTPNEVKLLKTRFGVDIKKMLKTLHTSEYFRIINKVKKQ